MNILRCAIILAAAIGGTAFGQEPFDLPIPPPPHDGNAMYFVHKEGAMAGPDVTFVHAEFGMEGKVVKGAPYSAQAVTEFTQTLSDGNRINRTSTSSVARDSEGRTRREQSLGAIGPFAASGAAPKIVSIHDPVAGKNYMLDANTKTANLMPGLPPGEMAKVHGGAIASFQSGIATFQMHVADTGVPGKEANAKAESLGSQMINGVNAQGTRTTHTIAAGEIGNDRPIEITRETWYSSELQVTVMSKTSDPRSGETVYRLTNIDRTEPPAALFVVPSDYTVKEGKALFTTGAAVKVQP
jgi:hypothetical protein